MVVGKRKVEILLDQLLDSYDLHKHSRIDADFLEMKNDIVHSVYQLATNAQRAGGEATRGVSSPLKARKSAANGLKGGRPAGNLYLAICASTQQQMEFATIAKAQEWAAQTPGTYKVDFYRLPYKRGDARIGYHHKDEEGNQQFRIY